MKTSKTFLLLFICVLFFASRGNAQTDAILATANGQNYTSADLDPETRQNFEQLDKLVANERIELLGQQIAEMLFAEEAALRKTTVAKLLDDETKRRLKMPSEAQIKAVYDANADQLGGKTLAEVKPQIIDFLQRDERAKALYDFVGELKTKHKVVMGKDVNAPNLAAADVLATVNGKTLTAQSFEDKNGQAVYDLKAAVYDRAGGYLENIIYSTLVSAEAKSLGLESQDLIAREISDKLKEFSDEERDRLQSDFQNRLFQKYKVKMMLKEPAPFVRKVSFGASDPSKGAANAPVTIVMFTDFQCPACAAAHPILQKTVAEYGDKVRLVVRDFPLMQLHKNAFNAAKAANAANAQGKFFEYTELLYNNQNALDDEALKKYAAQIGLNPQKFEADFASEKIAEEIRRDIKDGESYAISGTPTIFINGVKVRSLSAQAFRKAIDYALKNK